ncbi:subtilisin-like protein, partial [Ramicandelaber brevisporus]
DISDYKGCIGTFDQETLSKIRAMPSVASIEPDVIVSPALVVQKSETPWGLTRIIRPKKITDTSKYKYDLKTSGQGVKAYIIDTGVYTQHPDFTGRAIKGKNFVTYESDDDGHGHGSHVAGTVGGNQYGVAKGVTVVAVKVMDRAGNGPTSQIIRAIDWVVRQHKADRKLPGYKGSVINMSLTSSRSEALNNAAAAAVKAGVHVVAAAGNYYQDACQYSPGTAEGVISVGATDRDDRFASFSNWGKCVDILGPGVNVKSLRPGGGTTYMSGTSMSSPHVAGVVSYLLSESPSGMTPAQMKTKLLSAAVNGAISGFPDRATPNVLVF